MSDIQQDNEGPSPTPSPETKIADKPDVNECIPLSSSHNEDHDQEAMRLPESYMEAILEIVLEILINTSVVNVLATLFPAVRNLVGVGLIVVLVTILMEVFQFCAKIKKSAEFIKKKIGIYSLLTLGTTFLVADAIDKMATNDSMSMYPLSCPALPNPFIVDRSTQHSFQSSLSVPPNTFTFTIMSPSSEVDLLMHYVLSVTLLFASCFKACVLLFKVDFEDLIFS